MVEFDPVLRIDESNIELPEFILFELNEKKFSLPVGSVHSIIQCSDFTPVPHLPARFKGLINLRGEIVLVLDDRLERASLPIYTVIVVERDGAKRGILVNSVDNVATKNGAESELLDVDLILNRRASYE
jgi:purine-binding chemotaxis protein CheW